MRAAWLTDIHLNFLSAIQFEKLVSLVRKENPDVVFITGDICESGQLVWNLNRLEKVWQRPIYFVLGNHDYYSGSFRTVRAAVSALCSGSGWLRWMNEAGVVELTPAVGLIGCDGWADGRLGNYARSQVMLNDYVAIADFAGLNKAQRLQRLNALGDETAAYLREWLPKALAQYHQVYLLTHVPPFREACWHLGQISDDDFLPHFSSRAAGEALVEVMQTHPDRHLTVLCGHSHSAGRAEILDNLVVLTGEADYGRPQIQQVIIL